MLNLPKRSIYARHRVLFIWAGIVVEVLLLAALAVLAIVVLGAIYYRVTEDPKFCGSLCHNMSASYESYKASEHSGVRCAECHSEPGAKGVLKAVTVDAAREIYIYMEGEDFYDMGKLHPEIHDESCLRHECHRIERLVEQKTVFMDDNVFSHSMHLSPVLAEAHSGGPAAAETAGSSLVLNCISCHSQSKERHMAVDQQVCFLCHFADSSSENMQECSSCHAILALKHEHEPYKEYMEIEEDFPSCNECHGIETEEIKVSSEKCDACHDTKKELLDSASAHKLHVEPQKARCMECHEPIEHE
jgi:hypothetical protein